MFCISDWKSDVNQAHNSDKGLEFPISQDHQGTEVMLKSFLLTYWYESVVHRHPFSFPEMWNGLIIVQRESEDICICFQPFYYQMETLSPPSQILKM